MHEAPAIPGLHTAYPAEVRRTTLIPDSKPSRVTVFDLDRTITAGGTYTPFLISAAWRLAPWRLVFLPGLLSAMLAHKAGFLSRKRLKEVMQRLMLGSSAPRDALINVSQWFAAQTLAANARAHILDLVARELAEGSLVMIATAAYRCYAQPIASRLNVPHLVATDLRMSDAAISCSIDGANCYGEAKALRVLAMLAELGIDRTHVRLRCYSDDHSDLPLFEASDEPIAVSPTSKLRRIARERGWRIIEPRDSDGGN